MKIRGKKEYHGDAVCSKCHKEIPYGVARVEQILCRVCAAPKPAEIEPEIEPLKGDWVTQDQCLNKVCCKLDELIKYLFPDT